ncbi:hypothetical protein AALB39_19805 [Lachnospiraceae bacterium 54-53]
MNAIQITEPVYNQKQMSLTVLPEGHMYKEKIRSGQPFLYREGGISSMVMELRMKDDVGGLSLNRALQKTLLRYPYFTHRMIRKEGDFYLVKNPLPFIAVESAQLRPLGGPQTNHHLIDVTYDKKVIFISFHHGLCDGRGIMPFVRTLIYYYCTEKYGRQFEVQGVRLNGEPLLPGETKEPFHFDNLKADRAGMPEIRKNGFALPDSVGSVGENRFYRCEIKISREDFVKFAKENNGTPAVTAALLLAKAINNLYPEEEQPVMCNLASDLRKGIDLENTFKNCVGSVSFPYTKKLDKMPLSGQAASFREAVADHKKTDNLRKEIIKNAFICDKLDEMHSYKEKKEWIAFFNHLISNTFLLSYVGPLNLGECEACMESVHMYGSGTPGLSLQMMSAGEYITLNVMQSFQTDKYIRAFAKVLTETGVDYSLSGLFEFSTPRDSLCLQSDRR